MPPVEFEPTILASARPQTYALDRAATGIGESNSYGRKCVSTSTFHISRPVWVRSSTRDPSIMYWTFVIFVNIGGGNVLFFLRAYMKLRETVWGVESRESLAKVFVLRGGLQDFQSAGWRRTVRSQWKLTTSGRRISLEQMCIITEVPWWVWGYVILFPRWKNGCEVKLTMHFFLLLSISHTAYT
jgi:hypothetical protein